MVQKRVTASMSRAYEIDQAWRVNEVLLAYAPDGNAQVLVAKYYRELVAEGYEPREMVRILASTLLDGISYGNWPWVLRESV